MPAAKLSGINNRRFSTQRLNDSTTKRLNDKKWN